MYFSPLPPTFLFISKRCFFLLVLTGHKQMEILLKRCPSGLHIVTTAGPYARAEKSHNEIIKEESGSIFSDSSGFSSLLSLTQIKQVCTQSLRVCLHRLFKHQLPENADLSGRGKNKQLSRATHLHFKYTLHWLVLN